MKIVMKLGGSVITKKSVKDFPTDINEIEKHADDFIHIGVLKRFGREISEALSGNIQLILINGVGPFGHYLVDKKQSLEVVHESVRILNEKVVEYLNSGLEIEKVAPNETCKWDGEKFVIDELWNRGQKIINSNKILSTYGDILNGYKVISGDDLAVLLAKLWHADKIISVIDKDGVFTKNPELHDNAELLKTIKDVEAVRFERTSIDVTGGLPAKIRKLQSLKTKSQIINGLVPENIKKAMLGDESIGTLVLPK